MKLLILTCLIGNPLHFKGTAIEISKRYKQVSANKEKYAEKQQVRSELQAANVSKPFR